MDAQIIQEILKKKKKMGSMFLVDIPCRQFGHVKRVKTNITYVTEKIVWKSFVNF